MYSKQLNRASVGAIPAFLLFVCASVSSRAQQTDLYRAADSSVEARLVALALQGPVIQKAEHQNKINDYQVKKVKNSYLNLLTVSTNYTFRSTTKDPSTNYYYAPGMTLGVTIPIGIIFTKGADIKIARETREMNLSNTEQLKRETKADILTKYKQYQTYSELIIVESRSIDDQQAEVLEVEKRFRAGRATLAEYTAANKMLNDELATRLRSQLSQAEIKLAIEAIIGVSLESVINQSPKSGN